MFLRDTHEGYLSWKDADDEQSIDKSIGKSIKSIKKYIYISKQHRIIFYYKRKSS